MVNTCISWPGTLASEGLNPTLGRLRMGAVAWLAYTQAVGGVYIGFLAEDEIFPGLSLVAPRS